MYLAETHLSRATPSRDRPPLERGASHPKPAALCVMLKGPARPKRSRQAPVRRGRTAQACAFYQRATVADPDAPGAHFTFDLGNPAHAACFNVGVGPDGGTLISWSPLHALYTLPDGTAWAEHSNLWDADDLVRARQLYRPCCRQHVHE